MPGEVLFHLTDSTEFATLHADDFRKALNGMAALEAERDELRAENKRLQRENGSLARTYAACEELLRGRTEELNHAGAEIERLRAWAQAESDHWDGRNADRFWQMQRVLYEFGSPKDG